MRKNLGKKIIWPVLSYLLAWEVQAGCIPCSLLPPDATHCCGTGSMPASVVPETCDPSKEAVLQDLMHDDPALSSFIHAALEQGYTHGCTLTNPIKLGAPSFIVRFEGNGIGPGYENLYYKVTFDYNSRTFGPDDTLQNVLQDYFVQKSSVVPPK